MNDPTPESFSVKYRWSGWINLWCAILAVIILTIALNYFSHRHYQRKPWANNLNRELSQRTVQLLGDMTNKVDIIIFYNRQEATCRMVEELLQKYAHLNSSLRISRIDPMQQPKEARHIQSKFHLSEQQNNLIIFASDNHHKIVSNSQLSQMTPRHASAEELQSITEQKAPEEGGFVMERTAFLGERLFTSALLSVSSQKQPMVYCLTGHGEHSITNLNTSGYGEFGQLLGEMNAQVRDLELQKETMVPNDCKLLVIPGPKTEINLEEQRHISQYLERGGRLMILLNHRSNGGLSDLLRFWGILVGNNTVLDSDNTLGDGSITLRHYIHHPVVQMLQREDLPVRLLFPKTVSLLPDTDPIAAKQKMHTLIQTGPKGKAYRDFLATKTGNKPTIESQGSLPIAAAVERDTLVGVKTDHLARIVVVGDSVFLSNQMIDKEGNRELAWHTVNWLLDRSNLLQGIGPQPIQTYRFEFKSNEFRNLAIFLIGIMPVGTMAIGVLIWLRRRT